jgi:hypothetical protein
MLGAFERMKMIVSALPGSGLGRGMGVCVMAVARHFPRMQPLSVILLLRLLVCPQEGFAQLFPPAKSKA